MRSTYKASFLLLAFLLNCARPPVSKIDLLYRGLQELLPPLDPSILAGRVILLDPGHGGHFRGTTGTDSLDEADVNLGVALYLGGLLKECGAQIHITHWADRDFLSANDSSLAFDLEHRTALADSMHPDIFISIHHNAQSERKQQANAVETYYRFGDPASRDLAFAIHRHLMRNLGIRNGEVRQGNYYVLRSVSVPAVLGEASYLTNPSVEKKLRLSNKQRLEAEAYFLGILDYFRRGTPRIAVISPSEPSLSEVPNVIFSVKDIGGAGIDPNGIFLTMNAVQVPAFFNRRKGFVSYNMPWNSPNANYQANLYVRNLMGNSSSIISLKFSIDMPPERAVFSSSPAKIPPHGGTIQIRALLLDSRGLVIRSGLELGIKTSHGRAPSSAVIKEGYVDFPVTLDSTVESLEVYLTGGGRTFKYALKPGESMITALHKITILDGLSYSPVLNASIEIDDSLYQNSSTSGLYFIPSTAAQSRITIRAPGYIPIHAEKALADTMELTPWFSAVLRGKRFLVHPRGRIPLEHGSGRLGLTSSYVNLEVAQYLSSFIELAGGKVFLTRNSEETPIPQDIIGMANFFKVERYIEIRHSPYAFSGEILSENPITAYYYPGSQKGEAMANEVARSFTQICNLPSFNVEEKVTYQLQQTSCPAMILQAPSISDVSEELKLNEPWYLRFQAYAIFIGLLRHYNFSEDGIINVKIDSMEEGSSWLVTLDDTWNLLASPQATASFYACSEGSHFICASRDTVTINFVLNLGSGEMKNITLSPKSPAR